MALSQQQKNTLELMDKNPDKFIEDIDNLKINLDDYKNEFFQDGKNISHLAVELYSKDKEKYLSVLKRVLESTVSLYDSAKDYTAIDHFFRLNSNITYKYSDNEEQLKNLFELATINPSKINENDYSRIMHTFMQNEDKDKFEKLFSINKKIYPNEYWENIFNKFIVENDLNSIKNIIENGDNSKEEIVKIKWELNLREKNKNLERSNLLVAAVRYSDDIANYFLDNLKSIPFDLDGKTASNDKLEIDPYRTQFPKFTREDKKIIYSSIHPLNEAFELDKEDLFLKILNKLKTKQIPHLIYKEKITKKKLKENNYSYSSYGDKYEAETFLIDNILKDKQSKYYQLIKHNIDDIVSNGSNANKLILLNQILEKKDIDYDEKLYFSQKIIPFLGKIIEEKNTSSYSRYGSDYSYKKATTLLDYFLKDLYSKEKATFEELGVASKILELSINNTNTIFTNSEIYNNKFFNNPEFLNHFVASGLDINKDYSTGKKTNPFSFYYELKERTSGQILDPKKINKIFNVFKSLAGENLFLPLIKPSYLSHNNTYLLNYSLKKLDNLIFSNLTDKEILKLSKLEENYSISDIGEPVSENALDTYRDITKRMFNLGFSFFNKDKPDDFYKLLKFHNDPVFLKEVLIRDNKNIFELSKDVNFWNNINTEIISQFIAIEKADFSSLDMTKAISNFQDKERVVFNLYLKHGGNINYSDDSNDNFLHYLIKNDKFKEATHLLTYHSELSQQINKQEKIPLSYMIVGFDRECRNSNKNSKSDLFIEQTELFKKYLEVGDFGNNKKSKKFLMEQLDKYYHIREAIPDFKEIISYKILDASTQEKDETVPVKRNKI